MHSQGKGEHQIYLVCMYVCIPLSLHYYDDFILRKRTSLNDNDKHSLMKASHTFVSTMKEGPDYVCISCNRWMYRKTVQEFQLSKYHKAPTEFLVSISQSAG